MDKEAVEHMHETMQSAGRMMSRFNCPYMENQERSKTGRHHLTQAVHGNIGEHI